MAAVLADVYGFEARSGGLGKSIKGHCLPKKVRQWIVAHTRLSMYAIRNFRSRRVTSIDIKWADKIVYMSPIHRAILIALFGKEIKPKLVCLAKFALPHPMTQIPDPAFVDEKTFRDVMELIQSCVANMSSKG